MENYTPKISVIVPVYNVEQYLPRCIDSILAQTFTDFELLLIDDGSTDNSGKICDEYAKKDTRIRVWHKENGGVSSARNVGLDNARGELISFIDSDDWIDKDYFEIYIRQNADIQFQGYKVIDSENNVILSPPVQFSNAYNQESSYVILHNIFRIKNFFGVIWNKIFQQKIIEKYNIRFPMDISIREDEIFTFEYCRYISSLTLLPTRSYNYNVIPNSLMHRKYINPFEMNKAFDMGRKIYLTMPLSKDFMDELENYYMHSLIWSVHMAYTCGHLSPRKDRIELINKVFTFYKSSSQISKKIGLYNPVWTDIILLTKHFIKKYLFVK